MIKALLYPILLSIMIILPHKIVSQDIHFTNYNILPTFYNPAQTGAYAGNMRAGMIYRDQARNIVTPYMSGGLFVDSPILYGFNKQQWLGVGMTLFYDKAGEPSQTWTGIAPSAAYHIGFDKKFKNVLTIGVQYGLNNRSYSTDNFKAEDVINGSSEISVDQARITEDGEDFSSGFGDLNVGILFKSEMSKRTKFEIGFSTIHVLNPNFQFNGSNANPDNPSGGNESEIGLRLNFHTKIRYASSPQMIWEPSLYSSIRTGTNNTMLQVRNEYYLEKGGEFGIITGLGYRIGDSFQLLLGAIYQDYVFSLSYDQAHTELQGAAFELGAVRRFIFNKKPEVKPLIYCPRL